jgi:tripartite-type tricarboxylate transporter receptor subunit TctC
MIRILRRYLLVAVSLLCLALPQAALAADAYPTHTVKIIVPFAAGSGSDVVARLLARHLQERLGKTVIVDDQSGGATIVGTELTSSAAPDGYTLLLTTSAHAILPSMHKDLPFDVIKSFTPVAEVCAGPLIFVANPTFPAKNVKELIALAKAKPGQINYASSGTGTAPHLAMELLKVKAGIDIVHVPYRGGAPAMTDVIAGVVPMYMAAPATALPFVANGKVVALGQTTAERSTLVKNIPTVAEQGVPGYDVELWYGLLGPAKMPTDIVDRLSKEIAQILLLPDVRERLEKLGFEPKSSSPAQFSAYIEREVKQWAEVAQAAHLSKN